MIEGKRKSKNVSSSLEVKELREKLQKLKPPTELGKILLELSRKNLDGVGLLNADEIMSELGRSRYE